MSSETKACDIGVEFATSLLSDIVESMKEAETFQASWWAGFHTTMSAFMIASIGYKQGKAVRDFVGNIVDAKEAGGRQ